MNLTLHLETLARYGYDLYERPARLVALNLSSLGGGYTSAEVYRLDLEFDLGGAETRCAPVVLKHTTESEVNVMRALNDVPLAESLPQLIDHGVIAPAEGSNSVHWFVTPFYDGKPISMTDEEVPPAVIVSLARLHAHFATRLEQLSWLPCFDADAFCSMLRWVMGQLAEAEARRPDERLAAVRRSLQAVCESPQIRAAFGRLPATLIHGDVHGGNIIRLANGGSVLIDWGNARLAPAMFDLANMVDLDSGNWRIYLAAWEAASGRALDERLARLGYHLATVMVNSQYIPFVVRDWPANTGAPGQALEMVGRLESAMQAMKESANLR